MEKLKKSEKKMGNADRLRNPAKRRPAARGRKPLMSDRFPELANSPALDPSTVEDLLLTEAEFGAKYRRGRANREAELESQNTRIAFELLKQSQENTSQVLEEINLLLFQAEQNFQPILALPRTLGQAEAVFGLWFLKSTGAQCDFSTTIGALREVTSSWKLDEVDVYLLRSVVLAIDSRRGVQDVADRMKLSRQAIYARSKKISARLEELPSDRNFRILIDEISRAAEPGAIPLRLSLQHSLISIARMNPVGEFGHVVDLVRLAAYCAAAERLGANFNSGGNLRLRLIDGDNRGMLEVS